MNVFQPRHRFRNIFEITPELLRALGVEALLLDIDNTLAKHGHPRPLDGAEGWIRSMEDAGFRIMIVSNAKPERVEDFAAKVRLPFVAQGMKPLSAGFDRACRALGVAPEHAAVIGDQVFTDVLGGNLYGAMTLLVEPIEREKGRFFRLKRHLEKKILK